MGIVRYSVEGGVVKNGESYERPSFAPIEGFTPEQVQQYARSIQDIVILPEELIFRVVQTYNEEVRPAELAESKQTDRIVGGLEKISQWKPRQVDTQIQQVGELAVGTTSLLVGFNFLAQHDAAIIDYCRQTRKFYDTVVSLHRQVENQMYQR